MKIKLWDNTPLFDPIYRQEEPSIEPFLVQGSDSCMIVCAGGGYVTRCEYEAYPVCEWLQKIGINAFLLHYRVAPYKAPCMLADLQRAICMIRHHAHQWGISRDKIGAIGFSAGGHLVSAACTHRFHGLERDEVDREDHRLNAAVLCYPVITMGQGTHQATCDLLTGGDIALREGYSSENQVDFGYTPPCFIFHTFADELVPATENSIAFAVALNRAGVACELHVYAEGAHGLAMAGPWVGPCEQWLTNRKFR